MSVLIRSAAAALALGAVLYGGAGVAVADDDAPAPPNCTAADLAGVMGGVTVATSAYLFTHPEVNAFLTGLKGLPKDEVAAKMSEYGDANPQVRDELRGIRQPAADFHARCG